MCGIAGILTFDADPASLPADLQQMADTLRHRGPDGQGVYIEPAPTRCGLAHRRLAIIDLQGGHQPMTNEDATVWITYNGECYNFRQLRAELQAQGHQFRSRCDTEVLIHLYEEYGPDCVHHLRGMFAFAIWDQTRSQLFLARDRMGQKPLYYGVCNGRFIFASECKAIVALKGFDRQPDMQAISRYLLLGYVPAPASAFAAIRQLPPAHRLTVTRSNYHQPLPQRYWSIPTEPTYDGTFDQAAEHLRAELADATRMRMVSDVPLGGFLSGGVDSTIVVGLMSQAADEPVKACSIGFEEGLYNELPYARHAAHRFHCDHYEQLVKADCDQGLRQLSCTFDEPFADSSALPTWYLSRLARSHVTVALTGDGGDECFGGYHRYRALRLAQLLETSKFLTSLARHKIWNRLPTGEHHHRLHGFQRFLAVVGLPPARQYLQWMAVFDPELLASLLTPAALAQPSLAHSSNPMESYFGPPEKHPSNSDQVVSAAMLADGNLYLPGDLNTKIDRASMAVGLELRCPFQDHKVVELAYSLPAPWRHDGRQGKRILRHACSDLLPPAIRRRRKMGFAVPVGQWFRGPLRPIFIDTVLSDRAIQRGYFHRQPLERLLHEHDHRRQDHGQRLWSLLMLELWFRRYVDST